MTSLCTYSLIATIPPDIDETYRKDLVSAVLDDRVEEPAISSNTIGHVDSGVGLKEISPSGCVPFIACDYLRLSPTPSVSFERSLVRLVAVFCPSSLVASARQQTQQHNQRNDEGATEEPSRRLAVDWNDEPVKLSKILLSMIHPFLAQNFAVRAILTNQNIDRNPGRPAKQNAPCDVVILNLSHCPYETIVDELLEVTNCEAIHSGSEAILKVLLLSKLEFGVPSHLPIETSEGKPITASTVDTRKSYASTIEIPVCAVCLFRIDPSRLGLPRPPSHRLCSKFCTTPSKFTDRSSFSLSCPRQRLLLPWPPPNHCETCHIIRNYWMKYSDNTAAYKERDEVFCNLCGMQETLWVCLTCAFVGCGRYSNKHAAEHNDTTRHPFCLELSTLRIWSYVDSEFVHRVDLLECPASLQNVHQLPGIVPGRLTSTPHSSIPPNAALCLNGKTSRERISLGNQDLDHKNRYLTSFADPPDFGFQSRLETDHYERMVASSFASVDEKTPKKATMIGEEYEVLLQSALEDQAQYYEGEIAWLRATLSGSYKLVTSIILPFCCQQLSFSPLFFYFMIDWSSRASR